MSANGDEEHQTPALPPARDSDQQRGTANRPAMFAGEKEI
jgi:hypothetical protein